LHFEDLANRGAFMKSAIAALPLVLFSLVLPIEAAFASCSCQMLSRESCGSSGCATLVNNETGAEVTTYLRKGSAGAWISCNTMLVSYWRWQDACTSNKQSVPVETE
jgi:hypothetical protein